MGMMNDDEPGAPTRSREPKLLDYRWVKGHAYTVDSDLGVWHWQTTSPKGGVGWLMIGEACDVEDAEMMIADHATKTPVDVAAYQWAVLSMTEAD